ncbi:flagellar hook-associated protein FlgL [Kineococcus sp. SYSU DK004]|uniref:flagellar hook-associated protein FlgL n=1 Tax=Kineococcus sp. SYSU DK004 TaxID=3383125 RepID=UPI003D7DDFB4
MIGRVTQRSMALNSLTNLQATKARSAQLQEQLTSGTKLAKGSDDPVAAAAALRYRDQLATNAQHARNIQDASAWLTTQENALTDATKAVQRINALTVQAANTGSVDVNGRTAITAELKELKEQLRAAAGTTYQGRPVFAGAKVIADGTDLYSEAGGAYTYNGDEAPLKRTVAPGLELAVNVPATKVFGSDAQNVFGEIDALIATIEGGGNAGTHLGTVQARLTSITTGLGTIGALTNKLEAAKEVNQTRADTLTTALDDVEGVDLAKTLVEFNLQNTAYQAALQATAKVIQPTLLDFLR